jgi:FAD/FMN-containing dehydrogenase
MTTTCSDTRRLFNELASQLTGHLVLPEDAAYDQARRLWNGRVDKRPAALARCANAQDVVHTVRWARSHGLPLSVRGGGHDFAGRALCDDGVVIDCSPMRAASIDPEARTARIQGGGTVGDLIGAAQPYGLATATANVSSVGLAGLTLGGGYGPLTGNYGLVADNLLSAQVVTADGRLLTASAAENADLFWGLRGGGGNFGVVVSLEYRLHPIVKVLSGMLLYPLDQARAVLHQFDEFIQTAPDELTVLAGFLQMPDGMPALALFPFYCGPLEEGERALAPLRSFGQPLVDLIEPVAYDALIRGMNDLVPKGGHYFIQTQWLERLHTDTIGLLVEQAERFTSPYSVLVFGHFHGAASRVAVSDTAFALRQDHLLVEFIAGWELGSPQGDQRHVEWARRGSDALAPEALPGGYVNVLDEGEEKRVPLAFGPNYERLLALKRTYDPDDVFHSTIGHVTPTVR